jgi:sugar-specific transcriptional regulator TrmB
MVTDSKSSTVILDEMVKGNLVSSLRTLGLTTNAAVAFVTLLSHSGISASTLCKESRIPDSKIYYALDELLKKGMIAVRHSRPSLYWALPPKEAITNLKRQLTDDHKKMLEKADQLVNMLEPFYEKAEGPEKLEIAYILKGLNNAINKMNNLISSANEEVILLICSSKVLQGLNTSLIDARKRGVKVNIAVAPSIREEETIRVLGASKILHCECCSLIVDMRTLLTVSNWTSINCYAIITQDQSLITMTKEYFENPKCCSKIEK